MVSGNNQVTGQCDLEAPTDGDTIHRRNNGFVAHEAARDSAEANPFAELW
jgi:hypothetical protein